MSAIKEHFHDEIEAIQRKELLLKVVIEKGMHMLQMPDGQLLPRVIRTCITQDVRQSYNREGEATILLLSDKKIKGCCMVDFKSKMLLTPDGLAIEGTKLVSFDINRDDVGEAYVEATVIFPFDTIHNA